MENGVAKFEASPTGLLPGVELAFSVNATHIALLHGACTSMLSAWDERWERLGLDGICIAGMFDSTTSMSRSFSLWSPRHGSVPHAMLAAVFDCFPVDQCDGIAGKLLDEIRSYFGARPPATVINKHPMRIRLAPWLHPKDAKEIEGIVRNLPKDGILLVDASGVERFGVALTRILPITQLLQRDEEVRWLVPDDMADALVQSGIKRSAIEVILPIPISSRGEPIVLGGVCVPLGMIPLAQTGNKKELVRAFRNELPLTIEQAATAATELMEIVACFQVAK